MAGFSPYNEKRHPDECLFSQYFKFISVQSDTIELLLCLLALLKASAAINRSVVRGLEGDLCLSAAVCAYSSEVLARSLACVFLRVTACLASLGLVHKAFFVVESLLAGGEYELVAAIFAD